MLIGSREGEGPAKACRVMGEEGQSLAQVSPGHDSFALLSLRFLP